MKITILKISRSLLIPSLFAVAVFITPASFAQDNTAANSKELYTAIKSFSLGGGSVTVSALALSRDRAQMTFTGTFYFTTPIDGHVTGAVFVGDGKFSAAVPPSEFEKDNVKRLLGADIVESDFRTAVLRFGDDTFERLNRQPSGGQADERTQKIANDAEARVMKETGANLSARIALSILNRENPGFFFATFDGGKRGRFNFVLDYQNRLPVANFGAAFHPFNFGQGFPTLLMIPGTDRASKYTYVFIAHETAHQWWGDIVSWRSYRDQWLSEGFAEYSGILYTGKRSGSGARDELIGRLRSSLKDPPATLTGVGKGRLVDVGPIILGHRLSTTKTLGAYQALIYNKGALVLRMLHFLLTDPDTGNGEPFFNMMKEFVDRYRNGVASTDDFRLVANAHFARSPIAQQYRIDNLNWFFNQWVYHSELPSYQLEYQFQDEPGGKVLMTATVTQENVPNDWFMVLPVVLSFGGKQQAVTTVHAYGPKTSIAIRLPMRPSKVELDPQHWILSEKTSTKGG